MLGCKRVEQMIVGHDNEEFGRKIFPSAPPKPCFSDDETYDIVRVVRQSPPADYLLRISSFSLVMQRFGNSEAGYFESTKFFAGGYKWVMLVYPCGNKNEYGDGHISFYIKVVDDLHSDTFIRATYKFFVLNQIQDNFLTIQDLREKRFHALKTEWGIPKALELSILTNPSSGFLVNDCCVLGVEVSVIKTVNTVANMCVLNNHERANRVHTWRIQNFSNSQSRNCLYSSDFFIGGHKWQLLLYHKGDKSEKGKSLGLYLRLADYNHASGSKLYVRFELCLKSLSSGGKDHRMIVGPECYGNAPRAIDLGCSAFLPLSDFHVSSRGFIVKDEVVVEVNILDIFLVKAAPKRRLLHQMFCFA